MESSTKRRGTPLSVRIATDLHERIVTRAKEADQSVTDAVERALLLGLERQREWDTSRSKASLTSLFDVMMDVVRAHPDWLDNVIVFDHVRSEFSRAIDLLHPDRPVPGERL